MVTIHENIDAYLAADLHGELSESEREELHTHLMECGECRIHYKEEQLTHKVLQATLESAKPALGFEQRMLASFRNRVPNKNAGVSGLFVNALRLRIIQALGAAALFFVLVQTGRVLTGDLNFARTLSTFQSTAAEPGIPRRDKSAGNQSPKDRSGADLVQQSPATSGTAKAANAAKSDHQTEVKSDSMEAGLASSTPPTGASAETERVVVGSNIPTAEEVGPNPSVTPVPSPGSPTNDRKLVRAAAVDLEVKSFDDAVQRITGLTSEGRGYVATTRSEKQENGKLRGEVVVKVLPEDLDSFLLKLRNLGDVKNQTLSTEDVTKQYVDTDARLRNARLLETRLIELLKKKSDDVEDLLAVEKELGRVREQIEQLQGELKAMDIQVQFATVTISLAEKDLETPAGFLLKERAELSLFAADVEKTYSEIKVLASSSVQITDATLDRDSSGKITAQVRMLIAPESAEGVITKVKSLGRVENYQLQTERVARGGEGMSQEAKTERDKVRLEITISEQDQEPARQQTSLSIRAADVTEQSRRIRDLAAKQGGSIRSSSFSRDPNGRESATVTVRVPMQNYNAFTQSLNSIGRVENLAVQRNDRPNAQYDEKTAPADVTIGVFSQGNLVAEGSGLAATLRTTIAQGAGALMWSVRMIGVALAFLAPWLIAFGAFIGIVTGIRRSRRHRQQ